ncbi:MAG: tol-pal system protein YbgF [Desulfovibrio sp.]|jgi:tol-pal system protein YbgF|nr:tol-pal system protein YbgF [Desulfovibrio sp.]
MGTHRFFLGLALLGVAAVTNACVFSSSSVKNRDIEQQVQQQDAQLRQLQPVQADLQNEVQTLRAEINSLRGQLDDLQNAGGARAIVERVNRQDAALRQIDDRMALNLDLGHAIENSATQGTASAGTPMTGVQGYPANGASNGQNAPPAYGVPALSGGQSGMQTGAPAPATAAPAGTLPYQGAAAQQGSGQQASLQAQAPGASTWGQASPQPAPAAPVPQKDISLALFDSGVNAYNSRNYTEAQRAFNDFLKNYPSHNLVSEAQFYLAECQFQRNQFADAALAYDTVIKKYPSSSSAPGAYLKQGICFSKLNQKAAANARMQELVKKYPKSPEATRAKAFLRTNK